MHVNSYYGASSSTEASIKNTGEELTPGVSASFSCEICRESFQSRGEPKQRTIDKHSNTS